MPGNKQVIKRNIPDRTDEDGKVITPAHVVFDSVQNSYFLKMCLYGGGLIMILSFASFFILALATENKKVEDFIENQNLEDLYLYMLSAVGVIASVNTLLFSIGLGFRLLYMLEDSAGTIVYSDDRTREVAPEDRETFCCMRIGYTFR